jgi:hypothetical protein
MNGQHSTKGKKLSIEDEKTREEKDIVVGWD